MKAVCITNMPDHLYERLLERAQRQRRSLNGEIIALLEKGIHAELSARQDATELLAEARKLREHFKASPPTLERAAAFRDVFQAR